MRGLHRLGCVGWSAAALALAPAAASALTIATSADPADGWRALAPVGNLEGQPIASVGLDWEATHLGWNTDLAFDDSDAAGWHVPVARTVPGLPEVNGIWADDPGDTPAYFRKVVTLATDPVLAFFGGQRGNVLDSVVDDDAQIYVNGVLVYDDQDGSATFFAVTDVTTLLHAGENLIAVKAHDSFGLAEHFSLALEIDPIPEPSPSALVGLGLAVFALRRRSLRRRPRG